MNKLKPGTRVKITGGFYFYGEGCVVITRREYRVYCASKNINPTEGGKGYIYLRNVKSNQPMTAASTWRGIGHCFVYQIKNVKIDKKNNRKVKISKLLKDG